MLANSVRLALPRMIAPASRSRVTKVASRVARASAKREKKHADLIVANDVSRADAGFDVANAALQLHGGYGYLKDFPIERHLRDVRVHQILEGTNEIMRVIIARRLLRQ